MRALSWTDALPVSDPALQRAANASSSRALEELGEQWRPWRLSPRLLPVKASVSYYVSTFEFF